MKKRFTLMMLLAAVISWPAMQVFGQTQRVTMYFTDANGNRVSQMTATIGEEFVEPTVVVIPDGTGGRVVYESSDENVAYADMMSGEVTLYAAGTTTITATFGGTEEYAVSRTSYQLTVVAPQDTTPAIEPTCPEAHYNLNGAEVMTLHVGDVVSKQCSDQGPCADIVLHRDGMRLLSDSDIHCLFHCLCKSLAVLRATCNQYCCQ